MVSDPIKLSQNRIGDWAEVVASGWLMRLGYEVFRNMSCVGPVDIIAMKGGAIAMIDVKLVQIESNLGKLPSIPSLTADQIKMGVKLLFVSDLGDCAFSREVLVDAALARRGTADPRYTQYRRVATKPNKRPTILPGYGVTENPDWMKAYEDSDYKKQAAVRAARR